MQRSDELSETAHVLFQQFTALGETPIQITIGIVHEEEGYIEFRVTDWEGGGLQVNRGFNASIDEPSLVQKMFMGWKGQQKSLVVDLSGKELEAWVTYRNAISGVKVSSADTAGRRVITCAFFSRGHISFSSPEPRSKETTYLLERFAGVFDQTYTRFLDLQRSEAQAKEAQIEAALERVRSKTMAMQKSDELSEVIQVVYEQFVRLGINAEHTGFVMDYKARNDYDIWVADPLGVPSQITIPYFDSIYYNRFNEAKKLGEDFFATNLTFEEKNTFYHKLFEYIPGLPEEAKKFYFSCPGLAASTVLLENVGLYIENFSGVPYTHEENKTLMRFGKVFQQTYTRFLDLQKAESQTKKVKIEVALERVRARALAMQEPEELVAVAQVMRHEMGLLGIEELETSSIYIHDEGSDIADCWYAIKDIRVPEKNLVADHITLELHKTWVGREMLQFFNSSHQQASIVMQGDNRKAWINYCSEISNVLGGFYGDVIPDRTYHLSKFSNGALGAAAEGEISEESWELLRRATSVFSLAYSRFKDLTQARIDLQRLKAEKQRAEDALAHLKAVQTQLIQSEKMASLGELTAGIAHEIQNPLNFVNNFSDVNTELIEEMKEELRTGHTEEALAIAKDIADNEQKINHHGKRADAIVKGMLQHSRSSSGVKEPTDINALADEYLRLTYHGLRAKDKTFNATMKTDFDPHIGLVNIIPQDIGRVILNLITNAFYAVSTPHPPDSSAPWPPKGGKNYDPTISISTRKCLPPSGGQGAKDGSHIEISVADNGPGIPSHILDKIFQPFFTTKPTGQGTGLGLSLSYDIVKAHGGELKVETKEGEGSEFTITLPV